MMKSRLISTTFFAGLIFSAGSIVLPVAAHAATQCNRFDPSCAVAQWSDSFPDTANRTYSSAYYQQNAYQSAQNVQNYYPQQYSNQYPAQYQNNSRYNPNTALNSYYNDYYRHTPVNYSFNYYGNNFSVGFGSDRGGSWFNLDGFGWMR